MLKPRCVAVLLLILLGTLTPVGAANKEHLQLMADIRMLQEQTQLLQNMLTSLTDALQTVNTKLEEQSAQTRKAFADYRLLVDNLASDVRVIRERLDETNVRITSLSQELEALRIAMPAAPANPPPEPLGTIVPGTPGGPTTPPATTTVNPGMPPKRLYETAWADYASGQLSMAVAGFQMYLKNFPKGELADDAQYYIGESYFAEGKFAEAVAAYDVVIANYPGTNAVPDAYYKKGLALQRMGQTERARETFEFVVKNFPESDGARLAAQFLKRSRPPGD